MPRLAWPFALIAALPVPCQAPANTDQDDLVTRLADPHRRDFAIAELDRLGPAAVRRLIAMVDMAKPTEARQLLHAISELAHHAAPEYDRLADLATNAPSELQVEVFALRGIVIPFLSSADVQDAVPRLGGDGMEVALGKDGDTHRRFVRAIYQMSEFCIGWSPVGADFETDELIAVLAQSGDEWIHRREAAARLLALRGRGAERAAPALLAGLRAPVSRPERTYALEHWGLGEVRCPVGPVNHRWLAVALTRVAPDTHSAMEAHGYLARHGNPLEFERAFEAIRLHAEHAEGAVQHLIAALNNADAAERTPARDREVIITLGMLGEFAKPAVPVLRTIAEGEDRTASALARAALRSLKTR